MHIFVSSSQDGSTIPEWSIVEVQGDLETKSSEASTNGQFIGDLHFTKKVRFELPYH